VKRTNRKKAGATIKRHLPAEKEREREAESIANILPCIKNGKWEKGSRKNAFTMNMKKMSIGKHHLIQWLRLSFHIHKEKIDIVRDLFFFFGSRDLCS
jgi:hypothetical protein